MFYNSYSRLYNKLTSVFEWLKISYSFKGQGRAPPLISTLNQRSFEVCVISLFQIAHINLDGKDYVPRKNSNQKF